MPEAIAALIALAKALPEVEQILRLTLKEIDDARARDAAQRLEDKNTAVDSGITAAQPPPS